MRNALLLLCLLIMTSCQPPSPRFNHVMLYVSDLERSVEFYTSAFELDVERVTELHILPEEGEERFAEVRMALLRFPDQNFILEISENDAGDTDKLSPLFQNIGIDVNDINDAEKRLLKAGARIVNPIQEVRANDVEVYNAFYAGPDGESIELMQVVKGEF